MQSSGPRSPSVPLTVSVWQNYANSIFSYAALQSPTMIIEGSGYGSPAQPNVGSAYADAVASAAVANHAGVGAESLALNDQFLYAAGLPCSNDWCNIFNTYYFQAPIRGLQTISQSDPTCTSNLGPGNACSLIYILPFATQRHANVLEIANEDLLCAYGVSYSGCSEPNPFPPYVTALANAAVGQPSATSTTDGNAAATGKATLQ
jgi:hypothetical protein